MDKKVAEKWYPAIGEKVTLTYCTGSMREPYTVSRIEKGKVVVRKCGMCFFGVRYYDTLPDKIFDDKNGKERTLTWSPKRGRWIFKESPRSRYPWFVSFGTWDYQPNLD